MTADGFRSAEALRLNFVQRVVPTSQVVEAALCIAQALAEQASLAVKHGSLAAMTDFDGIQDRSFSSEDAKSVLSFIEKPAARFTEP